MKIIFHRLNSMEQKVASLGTPFWNISRNFTYSHQAQSQSLWHANKIHSMTLLISVRKNFPIKLFDITLSILTRAVAVTKASSSHLISSFIILYISSMQKVNSPTSIELVFCVLQMTWRWHQKISICHYFCPMRNYIYTQIHIMRNHLINF